MRPPTAKEMAHLTTTSMAVLEKALGKRLMKQTLATMSNGALWLRAPQTTMEMIKDIFEQAVPIDDRKIEEFAEPRMRSFNDVVGRSLATNPILRARTPSSLMRFLVQHARHVDPARVEQLKFEGMMEVLIPAEIVPVMISEPSNLFEPTVREAGRFLCDSIEAWYKELIRFLVELTCTARGRRLPTTLGRRPTLGNWIGAADRLWDPGGGPTGILDRELLELRNFFVHEKPVLDVRAETIVLPLGDGRPIGRDAFAMVVRKEYFKLSAMWFVLLAWTYRAEADASRSSASSLSAAR